MARKNPGTSASASAPWSPRESGGLVIAGDHGFAFLDEETGALTPIADPEHDLPDNRFNDGKCSPDGRFFAGTISLVKKTGARNSTGSIPI
jgi:sugar lactone lactonase YvrE